ncbi:MAG: efflux transporter outer membrane subunit [Gammaproteobacteria bacterium]
MNSGEPKATERARRAVGGVRRRYGVLAGVSLVLVLSGCTVGPDFVRPAPPQAAGYTSGKMPAAIRSTQGQPGQRLHLQREISAQWWDLFHSPQLEQVVRQAVAGNRSVAAARATLAAARENAAAARGGYYPQVDVSAGARRRNNAGQPTGGAGVSNLYTVGPTVSYSLDAFGGTRRQVEQQQALAEYQGYQLAAAYLSLTGNAVNQAITIASLRAQIRATQDIIAEDARNLSLVRDKFEGGKAARTDVLTAETQLASDRTLLPPLRQQLSSARHALSILVGRSPAAWSAPDFELENFTLPRDLPLSLPSALVRQRPDILAAEARLHADSAAIGVATAQLYPSITLSASIEQQSLDSATLFNSANRLWSLSGDLLAPIVHGGTLRAQRRAAVDTYRASLADYEQTVLQGLQQVADTLRALDHDAQLVAAQRVLMDTAGEALQLQRASYAAGKSNILSLIDAQRAYQQARLGFARARAQRLQDSAQLFVALGGGWWQAKLSGPTRPQQGLGQR